jgi:hypothetical protein
MATTPARQADRFYRRVSARLGEGTYQPPTDDYPVIAWAQHHRSNFTGVRERHQGAPVPADACCSRPPCGLHGGRLAIPRATHCCRADAHTRSASS